MADLIARMAMTDRSRPSLHVLALRRARMTTPAMIKERTDPPKRTAAPPAPALK
jgi:hypothetical protein